MYIDKLVFEKRNAVFLEKEPEKICENERAAVTMAANASSLGFMFSPVLIDRLKNYSIDELTQINKELMPILREKVGADVVYRPMYPNFPKQVMDASELELFANAIVHYMSGGTLYPYTKEEERFPFMDNVKPRTVLLADENTREDVRKNLLANPVAFSEADREHVKKLMTETGTRYVPDKITNKENLVFIASTLSDINNGDISSLHKHFKTPTDVLRYMSYRSEGDMTLAKPTRFKNSIPGKEARGYFATLENVLRRDQKSGEAEINKYAERWKRAFSHFHPCKYPFSRVKNVVDKTFKDTLQPTFEQELFKKLGGDRLSQMDAIDMLRKKPGVYARMLDSLIRNSNMPATYVVSEFATVAPKVSPNVLLSVMEHFDKRAEEKTESSYFIKGEVTKVFTKEDKTPPMPPSVIDAVKEACMKGLVAQYKDKDIPIEKNNYYIDPVLRNYKIPMTQRDSSDTSVGRGTRLEIESGKNVARAFIHWTDTAKERVDVDMSASMYDKDFNSKGYISYYQLQSEVGVHSGDITSGGPLGGPGVAEFVDVDLDKCKETGVAYVVFSVTNYTGDEFKEIPCSFGYMEREDQFSGEIFEPASVKNKIDLNTPSQISLPMILDVEKRQFVWADLSFECQAFNNAHTKRNKNLAYIKGVLNSEAPSVYDVIKANILAKDGTVVYDPEAFKEDSLVRITSETYSMDEIVSVLMPPAQDKATHEIEAPEQNAPVVTGFYDFDTLDDDMR